jgi:hypothetical protein
MEEAGLKEPEDLIVFNHNLVSDDEKKQAKMKMKQGNQVGKA